MSYILLETKFLFIKGNNPLHGISFYDDKKTGKKVVIP